MAKQVGDIRIRGTVAGVTFYKMDGQYYARKKSSLSGKRVKRDPRFRRTMEWAQRLARGSQLASRVYRSLPCHEQVYALFCTLKSAAIRGLKEGRSEEEVLRNLEAGVWSQESGVGRRELEQTKVRRAGEGGSTGAPAPQPKVTGKQNAAGSGKRLRPRAARAPQLVVGADGKLRGERRGRRKKRRSFAQGTRSGRRKKNTDRYDNDPARTTFSRAGISADPKDHNHPCSLSSSALPIAIGMHICTSAHLHICTLLRVFVSSRSLCKPIALAIPNM